MFDDYRDVVKVPELAEMLRVGKNMAYEMVKTGKIPGRRMGKAYRISKEDVIDYMSKNRKGEE